MSLGLSIFLNSFALMVVGACCAYWGMSACFEKRHALVVFWVYFAVKAVVWATFDAQTLTGSLAAGEGALWSLAIAVFAAAAFIVLYYTWDASFCKIGFAGVFTDAFCSVAVMAATFAAQLLVGSPVAGDYRAALGPGTAIVAFGQVVLFQALLRLARPFTRWFSGYRVVHERAWSVCIVVAVIAATLAKADYATLTAQGAGVMFALVAVFLAVSAAYMLQRMIAEQKRKSLLAHERQLASEYDRAMAAQLEYLDASAVALDAIAADVTRARRVVGEESLAEYASQLGEACEQLRHGVYSDCPALDVVLTSSEAALSAQGVRVEFRVSPLGGAANQAALVAQAMLGWALGEYGDSTREAGAADGSAGSQAKGWRTRLARFAPAAGQRAAMQGNGTADDASPTVSLRIARKSNQLVFRMEAPSKRGARFPRRLLEERSVAFQGALLEDDDGARKVVRALVGEDQPWYGR